MVSIEFAQFPSDLILQVANPGGWHGLPRLSWGFTLLRRSPSKAARGEEWKGENPEVSVSNGNPSRRLNGKGQEENWRWIWFRTNIFNRRPRQP